MPLIPIPGGTEPTASDIDGPPPDTPGIPDTQDAGVNVDWAQFLPPGVDPMDRSVVVTGDHIDHNNPVPYDRLNKSYVQGQKPYSKENWQALQVFQRSSAGGSVKVVVVNANSGGTAQACQKQPGRVSVTMSIPSALGDGTVPNGVVWSFTEGDVQQASLNACGVLNPGDSVTLYTEAQIWVGVLAGKTTGAVQVIQLTNPPSGPGIQ